MDEWYAKSKRLLRYLEDCNITPDSTKRCAGLNVSGPAVLETSIADLSRVATDAVSFHYVSEAEAFILFHLLSLQEYLRRGVGGPSNTRRRSESDVQLQKFPLSDGMVILPDVSAAHLSALMSFVQSFRGKVCTEKELASTGSQLLYELWPKTNSAAGHYSRPIRRQEEALSLFNFLFCGGIIVEQ